MKAAREYTVPLAYETSQADALRLAAAVIEWDTGMMEQADDRSTPRARRSPPGRSSARYCRACSSASSATSSSTLTARGDAPLMRAVLALIAGGHGRVCTTAAFAVTCAFLLAGSGGELTPGGLATPSSGPGDSSWSGPYLAIVGNAAGVADGEAATPAPKEADHG